MMTMTTFSQLVMEIYAYNFAVNKNIEKNSILNYKKYIAEKELKTLSDKTSKKINSPKIAQERFCMPVQGGVTTSVFGDKVSRTVVHKGHDWAVNTGTEVIVVADGVVEKAYYSNSYGYNVLVRHSNTLETRYAHLSQLSVRAGQYVYQKQRVGLSGSTGESTGPHLHFEVIQDGVKVNPLNYIKE